MRSSHKPWTEENQREHIANLKAAAVAERNVIDEEITKLQGLVREFDPLNLLARLAAFHLFGNPEFDDEKSGGPNKRSESQVEYFQSLALAQTYPDNAKWPEPSVIQQCFDLTESVLTRATVYHGLNSAGASKADVETWLRVRMMIQALHLRGDGYITHALETFVGIAAAHEPFLTQSCGFSSGQFLHAVEHAEASINAALNREIENSKHLFQSLIEEFSSSIKNAGKAFGSLEEIGASMEADAFRSKNSDRIDKWKAEFDRLGSESVFRVVPDTDTTARIYDRLSLEFGQNIEFLEKLPPWKGWPLNPSAIYARPLIKHRGDYYLFHVPLVKRSALRLIEGIIEDVDESYWRESFLRKRDEYLENASVELFRRLLPGSEYFQNLHYDCIEEGQAKRAEVDGLFIFDDTLLIVEAKASKFSNEARRGAIKSLKSDLDAIIDTAYRQGSRVLELVRSTKDVPFFDETGKEVLRVRLSNFERAFLVSVSLEKLSSLSTSLFALRTLGLIQGREWPWSVALNDLRVIAEITDHPTTFLHYLTRRVACNAFEQLTASDELDMFAHYMQLGLFFENDEQFKSTDLYMIASHTEDIDHYYEFQQGLRKEVPKPKISMMPRFEQLISTLETVRPRNFVSACLALLDFDDATRSKVAEQIDAIEEAEEKGRTRIVALPFGSRGDALILGNGNVNTPDENRFLPRCYTTLKEHGLAFATAIIWSPPLARNKLKVFLLRN